MSRLDDLRTVRAAVDVCHSLHEFASVEQVAKVIHSVREIVFPEMYLRQLIIAIKREIVDKIGAEIAAEHASGSTLHSSCRCLEWFRGNGGTSVL